MYLNLFSQSKQFLSRKCYVSVIHSQTPHSQVFGLDAGEFVPLNVAPDLSFNQARIDKALKRLADAVLSDLS